MEIIINPTAAITPTTMTATIDPARPSPEPEERANTGTPPRSTIAPHSTLTLTLDLTENK